MTQEQAKRELLNTLQDGTPRDVERALTRLIFWRASVSDLRGVTDAGLNPAQEQAVCNALPTDSSWFESLFSRVIAR